MAANIISSQGCSIGLSIECFSKLRSGVERVNSTKKLRNRVVLHAISPLQQVIAADSSFYGYYSLIIHKFCLSARGTC